MVPARAFVAANERRPAHRLLGFANDANTDVHLLTVIIDLDRPPIIVKQCLSDGILLRSTGLSTQLGGIRHRVRRVDG